MRVLPLPGDCGHRPCLDGCVQLRDGVLPVLPEVQCALLLVLLLAGVPGVACRCASAARGLPGAMLSTAAVAAAHVRRHMGGPGAASRVSALAAAVIVAACTCRLPAGAGAERSCRPEVVNAHMVQSLGKTHSLRPCGARHAVQRRVQLSPPEHGAAASCSGSDSWSLSSSSCIAWNADAPAAYTCGASVSGLYSAVLGWGNCRAAAAGCDTKLSTLPLVPQVVVGVRLDVLVQFCRGGEHALPDALHKEVTIEWQHGLLVPDGDVCKQQGVVKRAYVWTWLDLLIF